ncbi:SRPBCC domain-containing protein [Modestobacter sp. VKM Ac-2985]|uniref:SRPBCC domain-containing protein n=1 Tax=Modestobacter sp. VKM Ac-2985 TaxID=3004139 RepID=UPI0022ABB787|nr:SRPBCC domain-containing protein [Modestobacter sp. VKM Ac-2985]MCZ2835838.1 SRPBCC domain-containing protein [Modestobacter sp. VKM Ac-2985]
MRSYEAATRIDAGAEQVWAVLVDVGGWRDWNSGIDRVEGAVRLGAPLLLVATGTRRRPLRATVTEIRPAESMRWHSGLPLDLFVAERTFRLDPQGDGSTAFTVREEYRGPLAPLMIRTVPDLNPAFRQFAVGLKARVEQRAAELPT